MDMLKLKLGNRWAYRYREHIQLTKPAIFTSLEMALKDLANMEALQKNIFDVPEREETYYQEAFAIYSKARRRQRDKITESQPLGGCGQPLWLACWASYHSVLPCNSLGALIMPGLGSGATCW
jgi:hypothetical protein